MALTEILQLCAPPIPMSIPPPIDMEDVLGAALAAAMLEAMVMPEAIALEGMVVIELISILSVHYQ